MNIFAISGFINGLSALIFGSIVYLNNPKQLANRTFGLMTFALAIWSFGYGFWLLAQDKELALLWARILSIGSTFIPIFFLHWIFALFNLQKKKELILIFGYILSLIFLSFTFTPLYVEDVAPQLFFPWWPEPGIVYNFYLILGYLGIVGYGSYELIKIYKRTSGHLQEQIKYILLAVIVGFGGGATNFPLWYGVPFPPYGNFLVFLYPFILAYAILKHRLMDIKIILTEFLVGVIAFVLLIQFLLSETIFEYIWKGVLFLTFLFFGYLLIRSVLREIQRRAELQRLYQQVNRLSKAKSEFISIASHQLRTPLAAVKGYISMIIEGTYGNLSGKLEKPLENVYQSNERLIKLVNDLLNLSRLEAGKLEFKPKLASLEEMVSNIVEEMKINAEKKGLYLKMIKPSELLPKTMIDQDKLRQVILNIVDNAIKYTKKGGITIELKKLDAWEQIKVSDTGEGMTENEIKSLFQMFSRATAGIQLHTEGAGIGLHVAKKFVDLHNGKIWVESKGEGKGSTFYIELPIK